MCIQDIMWGYKIEYEGTKYMWGYKLMGRYKIKRDDTRRNVRIQNNARVKYSAKIQNWMWGYKIECHDTKWNVRIQNRT